MTGALGRRVAGVGDRLAVSFAGSPCGDIVRTFLHARPAFGEFFALRDGNARRALAYHLIGKLVLLLYAQSSAVHLGECARPKPSDVQAPVAALLDRPKT